jgi:hypothetical protein
MPYVPPLHCTDGRHPEQLSERVLALPLPLANATSRPLRVSMSLPTEKSRQGTSRP